MLLADWMMKNEAHDAGVSGRCDLCDSRIPAANGFLRLG